ncbi:NADH-quinone oxidoreductase subunit NuoK [Hydrogenibacillus sp. N12]|uniref:NADH-quinone oxidoreductase subunit NuoK n=1 Tax=Hydrogenibacillus sp. N12 TaxID=2866627 RepID=UPI001C7D6003|nr:NADH-quinone oxidoreductase subunit NuoK [Hydrogenibacillus sp. N12]QZA34329.1 NADH-quinone oxidoreductase subunit NuoK [Hydrogenibacillus sp. N12]
MLVGLLLFGAILFALGLYGALAQRNAVRVLLAVELMLIAGSLNVVALTRFLPAGAENRRLGHLPLAGDYAAALGQTTTLFFLAVAAAEVAIGLAAVIAAYRLRPTPNVDEMDERE